MKASVIVRLKSEVSDPQGMTIQQTVGKLGFEGIRRVRAGKFFEVEIDAPDADAARKTLDGLCDRILANPIIEDYSFEIEENKQ
jgi:phosphoribosylformylglycinamidine synthase PurS subunit